MSAALEPQLPRLVELQRLHGGELNPLMEEESVAWWRTLDWNFAASAALVRRFADMQALSGFALIEGGHPVGYSYYVCEDHKGLIGDLYVMERFATVENESRLLGAVIDALIKTPQVRRIESQLMMLRSGPRLELPHTRYLKAFERNFMETSLRRIRDLPPGAAARTKAFDSWTVRKQDETAVLLAGAYQGHIDSDVNDQYRSPAGARRFLSNIVQYPGCGTFFQPASFAAFDGPAGRLCGMSLASLVADDIGHITQICVSKAVRGHGVGYELLRLSLAALARHGCQKASLTVTASNKEAIRLYEDVGFATVRKFAAYVWDGF